MAVYEFECESCGHRFEVRVPISEHSRFKEQRPTCPVCQKSETRQLVSHFNCPPPKKY